MTSVSMGGKGSEGHYTVGQDTVTKRSHTRTLHQTAHPAHRRCRHFTYWHLLVGICVSKNSLIRHINKHKAQMHVTLTKTLDLSDNNQTTRRFNHRQPSSSLLTHPSRFHVYRSADVVTRATRQYRALPPYRSGSVACGGREPGCSWVDGLVTARFYPWPSA